MKKILSLSAVLALVITLFGVVSALNAAVFLSNAPFDLNGGPCIGFNGGSPMNPAVGFKTGGSATNLGYASVLWHEAVIPSR